MIDDELLAKFDRIQELPVSEEMLGAYLENNLSSSELYELESAIYENDYLKELTNANHEYNADLGASIDSALEDIELPIIPDDSFIELDLAYSSLLPETEDSDYIAACAVEDHYSQDDTYNDNNIDQPFEDDDTSFNSSDDNDISDYE